MKGFLVRSVPKFTVLFNEGAKGDTAYLLKEGRIEISGKVDNKKVVLAVLKPISIFGEMALILDEGKRTATAMALEDCQVIEITRSSLDQFLEESPPLLSSLVRTLVGRLKASTQKAARIVDPVYGMCRVLALAVSSDPPQMDYLQYVTTCMDLFFLSQEKVEEGIKIMCRDGLAGTSVSATGRRFIAIQVPDFMNRATEKFGLRRNVVG